MAPKLHRGGSTGQLRTHSRSSSATRIPTNIQKDGVAPLKHAEKIKRPYDANKAPQNITRITSAHHTSSREQLQLAATRTLTSHGQKAKAGFTLTTPSEDDDEWVSSESGTNTPNHRDSGSDTASDSDPPRHALPKAQRKPSSGRVPTQLQRVDTARPSQFEPERSPLRTPVLRQPGDDKHLEGPSSRSRRQHANPESFVDHSRRNSRYSDYQHHVSRPPSNHSTSSTSRSDHPLRPHPLIRGLSHGPNKPVPLTSVTVPPGAAPPIGSTLNSLLDAHSILSTSPSSVKTTQTLPHLSGSQSSSRTRRTSFSSTRSNATLPFRSSIMKETTDRNRPMSMLSNSSSSAALSSLAHLPAITRPPSLQTIAFFPPINPYVDVEGIHPLLPSPYLNNHLTVLAHRTPIMESFDRVIRAKQGMPLDGGFNILQ